MPSEFELIARYFARPAKNAVLGVGDDAALMRVRPGMALAVSTDMLVAGTHFFSDADVRHLGHKTLAVNLSDMAAMGARPRWALLSLALPAVDPTWLRAFSAGFFALARKHDVALVGGDTTRGPLNLCVTIMGEVPQGRALRRDGATSGDEIWVSGKLGGAALAVAHRHKRVRLSGSDLAQCRRALDLPQPRIALGVALLGLARSAIDISDGLVADLGHICERSGLGADVWFDRIPRTRPLMDKAASVIGQQALLAGGDDYELCFTASQGVRRRIEALGVRMRIPLTRIGSMRPGRGVRVLATDGTPMHALYRGFDHFG